MKYRSAAVALCGAIFASLPSLAQDVVSVKLPEQYLIARAPAGMEGLTPPAETTEGRSTTKAVERAAEGLPRKYTVVAPVYLGSEGNTISYLRFFNGQTNEVATNVLVVGSPSGKVYGTANVRAPQYSSPQYAITDILKAANVTGLANGDTSFAIYLEDPLNRGNNGFQHVIYNNANGFFENASMCTYLAQERYEGINQILINIHTSVLNQYPSIIYLHNYYDKEIRYKASITDARNGQVMGQIEIDMLPNSSYSVPFTYFENLLKWTPRSNQEHANMYFSGTAAGYHAVVGQMIFNERIGSYVNMTHFCAINHQAAFPTQ